MRKVLTRWLLLVLAVLFSACSVGPKGANTLHATSGPDRCGLSSVTVVTYRGTIYVRDFQHVASPGTLSSSYQEDTRLPSDAFSTGLRVVDASDPSKDPGLRLGTADIWSSSSEGSNSIYVVRGKIVERWPSLSVACV